MSIEDSLLDFRRLDLLAAGDTALHRVDARAKLIVAVVFIVCVMSFGRHAVVPLLPFFAFPILMVAGAGLPAAYIVRKVALVLPFAIAVALPNPWFDREFIARIGGVALTGGWVSFASILLRSLLAAAAAVVLVATTGFPAICGALERMGMPRPLAVQLLFLYRYLTVLGEEAARMKAARELRGGGRSLSLRTFGTLAGNLLLRTWDRAERIYMAMRARGFDGGFPGGRRASFGWRDGVFVVLCCALAMVLRTQALPERLGAAVLEFAR